MTTTNFLNPKELSNELLNFGVKKASIKFSKLLILGILAGVFIGFAAHLAATIATGWNIGGESVLFGLKKFFIGAVFSVGLMLVIIPGSELWTGNCLMSVALLERKISLLDMVRNWIIVYIGNLIGSLLIAFIIAKMSGLLNSDIGGTAISIAYNKVASTTPNLGHNLPYFFRAIACNWLVVIAVMMAISAQDITGKILAVFFPIMAFVASGFEHSIANMYFISAGIFAKSFTLASSTSGISLDMLSNLNWATMWTQNLIVVTLGNLVGGSIFVGCTYWFLYVRKSK